MNNINLQSPELGLGRVRPYLASEALKQIIQASGGQSGWGLGCERGKTKQP